MLNKKIYLTILIIFIIFAVKINIISAEKIKINPTITLTGNDFSNFIGTLSGVTIGNTNKIIFPNNSKLEQIFNFIPKNNSDTNKIYYETQTINKQNILHIGHSSFLIPQDIKNGRLDFILSLASNKTEFIYLGEYYEETDPLSDKRSNFFWANNQFEALSDYLKYLYPKENNKTTLRNIKIYKETNNPKEWLPPLIKHKNEWEEYCAYYAKRKLTPPKWFTQTMKQYLTA